MKENCISCKCCDISDFIFPDSSRSLYCDRFKSLVGFVSKDGEFEKTKHIVACMGENKELAKEKAKARARAIAKEKAKNRNKEKRFKQDFIEHRSSGVTGIYWTANYQRWAVQIKHQYIKKRKRNIGKFKDLEKAKEVLIEAKRQYEKITDESVKYLFWNYRTKEWELRMIVDGYMKKRIIATSTSLEEIKQKLEETLKEKEQLCGA